MSGSATAKDRAIAPASLTGRRGEMERLGALLERARGSRGGAALVLGQGGMGKTRLLRWLEQEARSQGYQVRWGNGLKEAISPFFAFEQLLRRSPPPPGKPWELGTGDPEASRIWSSSASFLLFEEERPKRIRSALASAPRSVPVLWISRENPVLAREKGWNLPEGSSGLWVTRMEGENRLGPSSLDAFGEAASKHFRLHPGGAVVLEGVEYLCSQNSFPPVLKLLQFLRDLAQDADGRLVVSVNPAAFERREVSLLESDAEVQRAPPRAEPLHASTSLPVPGTEPASATLLRYLRQVEGLCQEAPQLLIVDDLHWVDASSGTAFQFLVRNTRDLPLLLVGGAREEEISHESDDQGNSLADRLQGLEREGLLERMPLPPFGPPELARMAEELLGAPFREGASAPDLAELLRRTGGNPYFLRETILQLREDGLLRERQGRWEFARTLGGREAVSEIPTTLRRLVLQRLSILTPEERDFLDTACVAGSEFPLDPVASVRRMDRREALRVVQGLEHRRRLVEGIDAELRNWSFSHPLVYEVTIAEMSPTTRRREATALLAWWEEHLPEDISSLARLAHDASDAQRGLPWVRQALDQAARAFSPASAAIYLEWMHHLHRTTPDRGGPGALQEEIAAARRVVRAGGARQAQRFLEELLAEGLPPEARWEASLALARSQESLDSELAWHTVQDLREETARHPDRGTKRFRRELQSVYASLLLQRRPAAELMAELEDALAAPLDELDPEERVKLCSVAAWCATMLGRRPEGERYLEQALRSGSEEPATLAQVAHVQGLLATSRGDLEGAIRATQRAAEYFRQAGSISQATINDYNAAEIMTEVGRLDEAERTARELNDTGRKFDLPRARCSGMFLLARVDMKRGRWKPARPFAEEALREAELMRRPDDIRDCRLLLAEIRGEGGEMDEAIAEYERLESEGALLSAPVCIEFFPVLASFLLRQGQAEKAVAYLERALGFAESLGNDEMAGKLRLRVSEARGLTKGAAPTSGKA